jgi:hypothetical protein
MIKHLVFFKLHEHAEGASKAENAIKMKQMLEGLRGQIPELRYIEVGINFASNEFAWDVALTTHFDSRADLETYMKHPAHIALIDFITKVRSTRAFVDYES